MRKLRFMLLTAAVSAFIVAPGAIAEPAPESPIGGDHAHPHHVHTGNGGCVDINAVLFEPAARGLHRGANESGPEQGPFHGRCDQPHPHFPGQP